MRRVICIAAAIPLLALLAACGGDQATEEEWVRAWCEAQEALPEALRDASLSDDVDSTLQQLSTAVEQMLQILKGVEPPKRFRPRMNTSSRLMK